MAGNKRQHEGSIIQTLSLAERLRARLEGLEAEATKLRAAIEHLERHPEAEAVWDALSELAAGDAEEEFRRI